jgi:hypothetical protein
MENPYLLKMGLFGAAGHSPNHVALATRKVCQNDEILDSFAPKPGQRRWRVFGCVFGR